MLKLMLDKKTGKLKVWALLVLAGLIGFLFYVTIFMNWKNTTDLTHITESSESDKLVAVSVAAQRIIDMDAFVSYNSLEDTQADQDHYDEVLFELRDLKNSLGVEYIYALKIIDGEWNFVFDTDEENEEVFIPYDADDIVDEAFKGHFTSELNVADEYGHWNIGCAPLTYEERPVGVICSDEEAVYLEQSAKTSRNNAILLIGSMIVVVGALVGFLYSLLRRVQGMQADLRHMAHNDTITGLPNRLYLFEYLNEHMAKKPDIPFALVFVDLDNFKSVNDLAGHDAGDELLRKIGEFLNREVEHAMTFHPSAGYLNVSARVGGDEFIMVYPGAKTEADADEIAKQLFEAFKPEEISRLISKYNVSLSVGIALYPLNSENYHAIIKYADAAMYQAKKAGKNQYRVYKDGMVNEEK